MNLKHSRTVVPPGNTEAKVQALAWSPNLKKLAVCGADNTVSLFDEVGTRKDKFATKPIDSKYGKKSYLVRSMVFSPDSTKIAIGQTDAIVYIFRIGADWGEDKKICNKFPQSSAVTCMAWLPSDTLVVGLADGKVRSCNLRTQKSTSVYESGSFTVSLVVNHLGNAIMSGHADGAIIRYCFPPVPGSNTPAAQLSNGKVCVHPSPPYSLGWAVESFIVGGCDKRISVYSNEGRIVNQFDYSKDPSERDFSCCGVSPTGQCAVFGSYDRLRVFNWSGRKQAWEEGPVKDIKNLYTIAQICWKADGSKLVCGTQCGGVEEFECALRKAIYKNKFLITYVGPSQVLVVNLETKKKINLQSQFGYEIEDVKVLGEDRYLVSYTPNTLMLGDLVSTNMSEVPWRSSGNEKFCFAHEAVCMVFNAGELTLIEFGSNEILGSVRTEFVNPHLVSVRINERKQKDVDVNKKLAYLVDLKTICVTDLVTGTNLTNFTHDSKIDWLELNETCHKLLFRDKKLRLHLLDIESGKKTTLLNYCTFVQWVPGSDVCVAQSRDNLCIWYNIEAADRVTTFQIKGDVVQLDRVDNKTEVLVRDGSGVSTCSYTLDEGLIEFGTAMEDGDFGRAALYLETLELTPETEAMWRTLSKQSMEANQLHIAERCFAALGDISRARYLKETNKIAEEAAAVMGGDGTYHYKVRARMAILDKNFKAAENIMLEQNALDEVMQMYQDMHKWDEAIEVAEVKGHPELETLRTNYFQHLIDTKQEDKAAEVAESQDDNARAVELYLKAGLPSRAAMVIMNDDYLKTDIATVTSVAKALISSEFYEKAGNLFQIAGQDAQSLDCYRKGHAYERAIELARVSFPNEIIRLEDQYGDWLVSKRQFTSAINHFIEANQLQKALESAIQSHQWEKAEQLLEAMGPENHIESCQAIASFYASNGQLDAAEKWYLAPRSEKLLKECINMLNEHGQWERAHRLASKAMAPEEAAELYRNQANYLESQKKFKDAEKLFIAINDPDQAISMYKRNQLYVDMIRLVTKYHPDLLKKTHLSLAAEIEADNNLRMAEWHLTQCGEWRAAVNMYRSRDQWEDALRVARSNGGEEMGNHVIIMWARSLGGEGAVKLLQKFQLVDTAIEFAIEKQTFDFAFQIAQLASRERLPEVHNNFAMFLEDSGKLEEAEEQFIMAGRAREAVLMHVHAKDWEAAQRVAEKHDPDSVRDIYIGQAKQALDAGDKQKGESFLLRAEKPGLAVKYYKDNHMWEDALRVCREYLPNDLPTLEDEYARLKRSGGIPKGGHKGAASSSGFGEARSGGGHMNAASGSLEAVLEEAQEAEQHGDYARAAENYAKISRQNHTQDLRVLEKYWTKAGHLATQCEVGRGRAIVSRVAQQLIAIERHSGAAELYLQVDMSREAVETLMAAEDWGRAKKLATQREPDMVPLIDNAYKASLKKSGAADQLANVDVAAALDMLAERGDWDKCLDKAAETGDSRLLHKYAAQRATELIKSKEPLQALAIYTRHGAPAFEQNFNIYQRISLDVMSLPGMDKSSAYQTWADLRNMLLLVVQNCAKASQPAKYTQRFERLLMVSHLYAMRAAMTDKTQLTAQSAKISIALLRYTDLIQADKAFLEAAKAAKNQGWIGLAFNFFNRFLDICDAIEADDPDTLDAGFLPETDIPVEVPLAAEPFLSEEKREEFKQWVLTQSMNTQVDTSLPTDTRGVYEASLRNTDGTMCQPCLITGYPVLPNDKIDFQKTGNCAQKSTWTQVTMAAKLAQDSTLQDALGFITKWVGSPPSGSF